MKQKIKTILIPEKGLVLEPEYVQEAEVETDFTRTIAHLAAQSRGNSVILECTTDGRLFVAAAPGAFEIYGVENGVAANAFSAPNTYDQVLAQYVTDILIETNPAIVSFRDVNGVQGDEKVVPVGFSSIDLVHYGMRIRNRNAGFNAVYEFTIYR